MKFTYSVVLNLKHLPTAKVAWMNFFKTISYSFPCIQIMIRWSLYWYQINDVEFPLVFTDVTRNILAPEVTAI